MRAITTTRILLPILLIALIGIGLIYLNAQKTTTNNQTTTTETGTVTKTVTKIVPAKCECECKYEGKYEERFSKNIEHYGKNIFKHVNITVLSGVVVDKSNTSLRLVMSVDNVNYTVVLGPIYVRESDGVLVSGAYLFKSISVGETLSIKTVLVGNRTVVQAISLSVGGEVYSLPKYYLYEVLSS